MSRDWPWKLPRDKRCFLSGLHAGFYPYSLQCLFDLLYSWQFSLSCWYKLGMHTQYTRARYMSSTVDVSTSFLLPFSVRVAYQVCRLCINSSYPLSVFWTTHLIVSVFVWASHCRYLIYSCLVIHARTAALHATRIKVLLASSLSLFSVAGLDFCT